jgi:phospholipid/cholesterol/gamma-HCH transport system substrate-binding protein
VSKGLRGDKALDISPGDIHLPEVGAGEWLPGSTTDELANLQQTATNVANQISQVTARLESATRPLQDNPALANDILGIAHDMHAISTQIASGPGTAGRLLRDPHMADEVEQTLASTRNTLRNVDHATGQVEGMMHDARTGQGLIHALIYDPDGAHAVSSMGHAADELASITRDIRTGNGGMHQIIYGNDSAQALANLNQATASARDILRDVQRGRGTIGALLVDPSLYDDVKSLVGNLQRNEILRSLVRYSIHASERDAQPTPRATSEGGH